MWYLDKEGRLCYVDLGSPPIPDEHGSHQPSQRALDSVAPTLFQMESIVKGSDFLWREYKRLTDPLIDGDYIGPLRGETNCALNVLHYLLALERAVKELDPEAIEEITKRAYEIRAKRWPEKLGW